MKNGKSKNIMDTRVLVKASFLTAISIVLTRFFVIFPVPTIRIAFGEVPIMMSGMIFGPVVGGITGLAADLIGVLVNSQGTFHPGFTLSSILWGVIPGLLFLIFKKYKSYEKRYSKPNIVVTVTICFIIISLGLNTLWLSQLFGEAFMVLFKLRAAVAAANILVQSLIIIALMKYLKSIINA